MRKVWFIEYFDTKGIISKVEIEAKHYTEKEKERVISIIKEYLNITDNICAYATYVIYFPFSKRYGVSVVDRKIYVNKAGLEF